MLICEIKENLVRVFVDKGFACVPLSSKEVHSALKSAFPLGRLKRIRNEKIDIIEFQFDKYGRPKFVINFGVVPEDGVTLPWGAHIDRDEVDASACPEAFRLYNSTFIKRWFQLGFFAPKTGFAVRALVDTTIKLSQEILEWFDSKAVGKHMRKSGINA
jgi:hypothetical protein